MFRRRVVSALALLFVAAGGCKKVVGGPTLAGTVTGAEKNQPLVGAQVELNDLEGERQVSGLTDKRGRFRLPHPPMPFALTVTHPDGVGAFVEREGLSGEAPLRLPLPDPREGGTVVGTVTGEPTALLEAWRFSDDEGDIFRVPIDADGSYTFVLPSGTYALVPGDAIVLPTRVELAVGSEVQQDLRVTARRPTPEPVLAALRPHTFSVGEDLLSPMGSDGLEAFGEDTRVLALGESTHGTSDFFVVKHGLIRQLVEEGRTHTVAMEANVLDAEVVEAYVQGTGSLDAAMDSLFLVWRTEEMRDLLVWIHDHNKGVEAGQRVRFVGYDVQDLGGPRDELRSFLSDVRPEWIQELEPLKALEAKGAEADEAERQQVREMIASLREQLEQEHDALARETSPKRVARALRMVDLIGLAQPVISADMHSYFAARDRGMALNVERLLTSLPPDELVVVWAHNGHIANDSAGLLGTNMGTRLKETLGDQYVSVGLHTRRGEFTVSASREEPRKAVSVSLDGSAPGFYTEGLGKMGAHALLLDVRSVEEPGRSWLEGPRLHHSAGWLVPEGGLASSAVQWWGRFDFVLFVDETSAATRVP